MTMNVPEEHLAAAVGILEQLVAFDTTSHRSNMELVTWVNALLSELGATTSILPSPDGRKANLFATLGPVRDGGLVLSGHSDVVPADAADWASPPFELSRRGDRLHGRGACDMKGSIACALAFAKRFDAKSSPIPIHLALSYDEELGCLGVPGIISEFGRTLPKPGMVFVVEPTSMRPIVAHKGYLAYETRFLGEPAHSSRPGDGISAIRIAVAFISALEALGEELSRGVNVADMTPSFSTINVGRIEGGWPPMSCRHNAEFCGNCVRCRGWRFRRFSTVSACWSPGPWKRSFRSPISGRGS